MFVSCWSVKGGAGTTVVATALALVLASATRAGSVLVDLAGDVAPVLGIPEPEGPGVAEWLAAGDSVPTDGWARLALDTGTGVSLVPRGRGPLTRVERAEVLAGVLGADHRPVVVDCGVLASGPEPRTETVATVLAAQASTSLLVTRTCYLGLRRATRSPVRPSGIVVVHEPGRHLHADDVAAIVGAEIWAEVELDPAVARAVDAGVLASRMPRALRRSLREAA